MAARVALFSRMKCCSIASGVPPAAFAAGGASAPVFQTFTVG
jgi:hypothetical protein